MSDLKSYTKTQSFFRYAYNGKHDPSAYFNNIFLTFNWRGQNSWVDYGCFIINNKDDLHWVGQTSKNTYSSPLYGSNTQTLSSITFNITKISLKLGLYGITKQDYAKFFMWMDPLVIDKFYFDYDKNYYYKLKVSNIKESNKYIIGTQENDILYYVETTVEFEIQGENCGWSKHNVNWIFTPYSRDGVWYRELMNRNKNLDNANWISELRNGIEVYIDNLIIDNRNIRIQIIAEEMDTQLQSPFGENKKVLCELTFQNTEENISNNNISFIYDSTDGIVYNSEDKKILSFSNVNDALKVLNVSKFLLPSKLQDKNYYTQYPYTTINRDVQLRILAQVGLEQQFQVVYKKDNQNEKGYYITVKDDIHDEVQDIKICNDILITSQLKTPLI